MLTTLGTFTIIIMPVPCTICTRSTRRGRNRDGWLVRFETRRVSSLGCLKTAAVRRFEGMCREKPARCQEIKEGTDLFNPQDAKAMAAAATQTLQSDWSMPEHVRKLLSSLSRPSPD